MSKLLGAKGAMDWRSAVCRTEKPPVVRDVVAAMSLMRVAFER